MALPLTLRRALRPLHPARLRFKRLLSTLNLDPGGLGARVEPPGSRDFIICGCPRTGTSLLAAVLHQPPHVITVTEPWDGLRLPPADLFLSLRAELQARRRLSRGTLDVVELVRTGSVKRTREELVDAPVDIVGDWQLGVKWPCFYRYLELLRDTRFLVCLRDPFEVIRSFERSGGSLYDGLDYSVPFNASMNASLRGAAPTRELRRIRMYDYVHERIIPHLNRPNVFVVRYERWFRDPDALIRELGEFLGAPLGRGYPRIRKPESRRTTVGAQADLIRRECRTAAVLGYALE